MVVREKEYMKLEVGKAVDCMTQGSCNPTDSIKSGYDCSSLIHSIENDAYLIRIRAIRHTWLVKVMISWVGNIRVKRGRVKYGSLFAYE